MSLNKIVNISIQEGSVWEHFVLFLLNTVQNLNFYNLPFFKSSTIDKVLVSIQIYKRQVFGMNRSTTRHYLYHERRYATHLEVK